jgi:hypothetical protein
MVIQMQRAIVYICINQNDRKYKIIIVIYNTLKPDFIDKYSSLQFLLIMRGGNVHDRSTED